MTRPNPLLMTTVVLTLTAGTSALAQAVPERTPTAVTQIARAGEGSLHGVVSDEAGGPVEGATVSAIGEAMAFAVTDRRGRFGFDNLPVGRYLVRVHRSGYSLSQREYVQIQPSARIVKRLELRRDGAVGTAGSPDAGGRILAAALGEAPSAPPAGAAADDPSDAASSHPHNEAAWRLRHVRRSVLKEASETIALTGDSEPEDFARGVSAFPAVFGALPFSGEINLLTTSALDRASEVFANGLPRGITYLQLGSASEGAAGWTMQAAVSQGDISSWIVAGSFTARGPREHAFDMGLSFGTQEYAGGNPAALAVRSDGSRRVGTLYAYDNWAVSPLMHVAYGARVARYDYVSRDELWNPRLAVAFNVADGMHVRASVAQGFRAPGAEEFLPPQSGPWLPPERTFSPLGTPDFRVERIREVELTLEREFHDSAVVAVRRFFEAVDDQLVTVFGARSVSSSRSDIGHYLIGTVGAVDADGWGVKVSSPADRRLRGSLDYSLTRARWLPSTAASAVAYVAPSAVRPASEDVHDVSTSVEADINETATRVFFYYRISTGYARDDELPVPMLGARFDLQVRQGLPFMPFRGSEWQVLVGIRDLFRDPLDTSSSTYDELLVVRPPKRVMGGVQVKF